MEEQRASATTEQPLILPLQDLPREYRQELYQGCSTGWSSLDYHLMGLRPGELTVVTADTGVGKTTFCLQLLYNCVMQGIKVWINSWEMRPDVIQRKIASMVLRKPLKFCAFTEEDNAFFDAWLQEHCFQINPSTTGMNLLRLERHINRAAQQGITVILLDHLDYLITCKEQMHLAIEETVKRLHELVFHLGVHFVLICHPKQVAANEEISMNSLKGSASIKQYADNILILHRCKGKPNRMRLDVVKNRHTGKQGSCYFQYQQEWDGYLQEQKYEGVK